MYIKGLLAKYRVVFVAICANMMSFSYGVCVGWTSPVMPKLKDQTVDSSLNVGITPTQEGWISSLLSIGALIVSIFIGSIASAIGRKWTLLLSSFLIIISFIFLILATDIWYIYVARFLQGCGGGGGTGIIPMYIGEIASDDTRGALGSLMAIFIISGTLYTYIIGPYVSFLTLQYYCMAIPILFFVTFLFMPESPFYFAMKGQSNDLINSLKYLRGISDDKDVEDERLKIQKEVDDSMANRSRIIDIVQNRVYRKALFITCGLLVFQEMSGITVVTFNSQSIFISAGSTLDPALATIILGVVQLVANLLTPFVIEHAGRRKILFISSIGMCVALVSLGIFFYIQAFFNASNILWLPVPALIVFNAFYGFGFGPVPWVILGELLPSNIKSTATSIACSFGWALCVVATRWFPELNALGAYYAFWIFGGVCGLALLFIKFVVIETKGLSLQVIQIKLQGSK